MITVNGRACAAFICVYIWFHSNSTLSYGVNSDIDCLRSIKESLHDKLDYLNSWNFDNNTAGFICKFVGIECWHPDENKVWNIQLGDKRLRGQFPRGLEKCSSLTGLNLSSNDLDGNIPSNISNLLSYVTNLDLSSNKLSGEIPVGLVNCTYLNVLKLDDNKFTGQIPPQIGLLGRIKTFSVAKNKLNGPVPNFTNASFPEESYADNPGLCGGPLPSCQSISTESHSRVIAGESIKFIVGAAAGGLTIAILLVLACYCSLVYIERPERKRNDPEGNK